MEKRYHSFVVKIHDSEENPRGYIEHVSSQERAYFEGLASMNRFITEHLRPLAKEKDQINGANR